MVGTNKSVAINLWSGPRNLSTAMMYSFSQRPDTVVYDEPLYAHYLIQTGADHPGREQILSLMENDGQNVISNLIVNNNLEAPYIFSKHMINQLIGLDKDFILKCKNIIYIRDPKKVIISYSKVIEYVEMDDIGIREQWALFDYLRNNGSTPVILDSSEILKNPRKALEILCESLQIPFHPNMLSWSSGPKQDDGPWASIWYQNVHKSTGFSKDITKDEPLPERYTKLYEECKKYYDQLRPLSIVV